MIAVIFIECFGLSYLLSKKWKDVEIFVSVLISNGVSGILGFIISMVLNGGWWLVVWFPWVSSNEVHGQKAFMFLLLYYLVALVLTLIIEIFLNVHFLNTYPRKKVIKNSAFVNTLTYVLGSFLMYAFSFDLIS